MFRPDDPLNPPGKVFDEPWQAEALALADSLVKAGLVPARDWAGALGRALSEAEAAGAPDTAETYFTAVVTALERLCQERAGICPDTLSKRRADWEAAYRRTPHGKPVRL